MTNEQLKRQLQKIDLKDCVEIKDNHIYYIEKQVKQRCTNGDGSFGYFITNCEFLIIAKNGEKQAIILRCGETDLHWFVIGKWRKKQVLSNALRTGIIKEIWPENKNISCCSSYDEDYDNKYMMTKHLGEIAGLEIVD